MAATGRRGRPAGRESPSVPIDLFHVAGLDRKLGAPLVAPGGQHLSPAAGGHARTEPVHTGAAADLRLIHSFGHENSLVFWYGWLADYTSPLSRRSSRE
jgi:hypothetical protein